MSRVMRKPVSLHIFENCAVDQQLCFRYSYFVTQVVQSLPFLFQKFQQNFKPLTILCGLTARFVSDLVGNPEDRGFRVTAPFDSFTEK